MNVYTNAAKRPFDWPFSYSRSTNDLITLAPPQSQLIDAVEMIGEISERCKEKFSEFNKHLKAYGRSRKQTKSDRKVRLNAATLIENCLAHEFPGCSVVLVGSWASRCGCESSRTDVTLVIQHKFGQALATRDFMRSTLSRVETILTTTGADHFTNVAVVTYTQIPHLQFQVASGSHEFRVRMSINQLYDIASAHLLYHYAKIDKRFAALCLLVKEWAKASKVASERTFRGHTLNLLVLHYLMCATLPPVLPNLQQKYAAFHVTNAISMVKDLPRLSAKARKKGPLRARELRLATSTNTRSVAYLLMGFFHYYSSFDCANRAICVVHGCCVARKCLPPMTTTYPIVVMDPYEPLNVARNIKPSSFRRILCALRATRDRLLDPTKPPSMRDLGLTMASNSDSEDVTEDVPNNDVPNCEDHQNVAEEEAKSANSDAIKRQESKRKLSGAWHAEKTATNATTNEAEQKQEAKVAVKEQKEHADASTQTATEQNVWNNDMFRQDLSSKIKKVQCDTGTSVWGDPAAQLGEIRRWKTLDNKSYEPSGGAWRLIPIRLPTAKYEQKQNSAKNRNVTSADDIAWWIDAAAITPPCAHAWGVLKNNAGSHAGGAHLPIRAGKEELDEAEVSFNDLGLETIVKSDSDMSQKLVALRKTENTAADSTSSDVMLAKLAHSEPDIPAGTERTTAGKKRRRRRRARTQFENQTVADSIEQTDYKLRQVEGIAASGKI